MFGQPLFWILYLLYESSVLCPPYWTFPILDCVIHGRFSYQNSKLWPDSFPTNINIILVGKCPTSTRPMNPPDSDVTTTSDVKISAYRSRDSDLANNSIFRLGRDEVFAVDEMQREVSGPIVSCEIDLSLESCCLSVFRVISETCSA